MYEWLVHELVAVLLSPKSDNNTQVSPRKTAFCSPAAAPLIASPCYTYRHFLPEYLLQ
ncbi:hypothetical protein [Pectobacterium sp. B1J-3]|uniref:hypothetical protein n=1 Tax=Pectobacterium sp. B1J-3 TaxID=3385371 RepID=UPI0039067660